ncbi:MAG: hypothetical protein IJU28_11265 [Clostridia bacterium]|nr:hypothetical protein [Clostridia bacterium]
MCWILYGALQGKVDADALHAVNARHACHFELGTRHAVKMAVTAEDWAYRLTDGCCDCESPIGAHDPGAAEVADMAALIAELCALDGAETLTLCKTWRDDRCRQERAVKRSEADLPRLLADLAPRTLYTLACKA